MKPQSQPRPVTPPRRPPARSPQNDVDDIDFFALRQMRVDEARPLVDEPLRLVPRVDEVDSPVDEEKLERLLPTKKKKVRCAPCHWGLLVCALLLTGLSVPLVYSASTPIALDQHKGDPDYFLFRQIGFGAVGLLLMIVFSRLSTKGLRNAVWIFYGAAILGLLATTFSPLGHAQGNTERWVKLGPISLQFSEVAKIALVGVMADFWSRAEGLSQKSMAPWIVAAVMTGVPLVLVWMQPHLSAAIVLFSIPVFAAFFAGAPRKHFARIFVPLAILVAVTVGMCRTHSVPLLKPYQQDRIAALVGGSSDDGRGSDYQQNQGGRAIARGGFEGVGLGNSLYKNGHLPAPHTDFVFAVISEELGLWGAFGILTLYGLIVFFCFQTGHASKSPFEAILCAGVGSLIGFQVVGNIAVVTKLAPVTGLPLPILTYGGSGMMCALVGIGLVLAVSRKPCDG